eukprot:CAMPEP_0178766402 /NCGR_PEP_ID=MMETSP0744-20121128/19044_1 /TAXON_ID=913974 /ORGANISM="Nitzschia punctata, Strain CCMP561" /LENGTH=469 /DNA_ID=CAMNT_0020422119 /DNA_START=31 /DNA_END=1440 /DNA_ORIENTATION=+
MPSTTLSVSDGEEAIQRFQEFLKFETVSATAPSTGAYKQCAEFLRKQLMHSTLKQVLQDVHFLKEAPDHSPVVVAKWLGKDPTLPVLLLNSHYDVVPADLRGWTVPPFEAIRKDGKIYGRGTQDMKCVCMQYIEALRKIVQLNPNWQPERSIYLTFVPDEEVGGSGMAAFLESDLYKKEIPGIALALDEGLASTTNVFDVFYGERLPWWVEVTASGSTGHGSRFIENTAVEKIIELSKKALEFRTGQRNLLEMNHDENCTHAVAAKNRAQKKTLGDVTSLNITTLQAGVAVGDTFAFNVVPSTAKCSLDIRISPHVQPQEIKDMLDTWCQECSKGSKEGSGVTWKPIEKIAMDHATTETDRKVNPWYAAFCDALQEMEYQISPQVFPAATDSRFLRALGIRALGFSPMRNTEILLHEHDEYILESNFLEGIEIYIGLIRALGSQGKEIDRLADKKRKANSEEKKDDSKE